jgi:inorganic pyrophosphatase
VIRPALVACVLALAALGCAVPARRADPPEPRNFLTGYDARTADGLVNMVVEIPAGTNEKWETLKSGEGIEWEMAEGEGRVIRYLAYPANYGMVPATLLPESEGGDGDPLDAVLLGPAVERGAVVPVRVIGVLRLVDDGERDDKLIAVPREGVFSEVTSLEELEAAYPGVAGILETWFTRYKGPGRLVFEGFAGEDAARRVLDAAVDGFRRHGGPR